MKSNRKFAVVTGKGKFPLDMLRYDRCFPFGSEDSGRMDNQDGKRTIIVMTESGLLFTRGRWESFGWVVVDEGENYSRLRAIEADMNRKDGNT